MHSVPNFESAKAIILLHNVSRTAAARDASLFAINCHYLSTGLLTGSEVPIENALEVEYEENREGVIGF